MKFLVQDTGASSHPLHVARAYHAALTGRIPVRHFALVDDGHRLETAMGMFTHPTRPAGRRKVGRAGIVEQQKGAQLLAVAAVGEERAYGKAVAYPVRTGGAVNAEDLFHLSLLTYPVELNTGDSIVSRRTGG